MIQTRQIQLLINEDNKSKINDHWNTIRQLQKDVAKAANSIVANMFFTDEFTKRIILNDAELLERQEKNNIEIEEKIKAKKEEKDEQKKEKIDEEIKKLRTKNAKLTSEARQQAAEFYYKNESTDYYQKCSKEYPLLPSYVVASLVQKTMKEYNNDKFKVNRAEQSVRTYKKTLPIPFNKKSLIFSKRDNDILVTWFKIPFILYFGRDKSNERLNVERCLSGEYKLCDSAIQNKKNKIYLQLVIDVPTKENTLDPNIIVGVDLGLAVPACCAINNDTYSLFAGSLNDFLRVRLQIQNRRRSLQKSLKLTNGGHGRNKKLKALDNFKEKERNWAKTYNNQLSKKIVEFAKRNSAGQINIEFLEGFSEDEKHAFVLRNWSYYELQQMIITKATREGILVKCVDPYRTSKICSECGSQEKKQRKSQAKFVCANQECKNHENSINADYNAALNISRSTKYVTKKEECQYFKIHKKEKQENKLVAVE